MTQKTMGQKKLVESTLLHIAKLVNSISQPYCVFGSASVCLRNLPCGTVSDVDLLTTEQGVSELATTIGAAAKQRESSALFRSSLFLTVQTPFLPVEVMADLKVRAGGKWLAVWPDETDTITVGGSSFVVASLKDQLAFFERFSRPKDIARIAQIKQTLSAR
ncbi:MAG: hypothetical protein AAFY73_00315 [Pseudomonadota bacterium]